MCPNPPKINGFFFFLEKKSSKCGYFLEFFHKVPLTMLLGTFRKKEKRKRKKEKW